MQKGLLVSFMGFVFVSCASELRKRCDATNWYEHGSEVAKQGKRLNQDTFLQQCEKEKAKINHGELDKGFKKGMGDYCDDNYSFLVGKRGDFLNLDLCDTQMHKTMGRKHQEGVLEFCKKDNGSPFGSTGNKYNGICPPNLEKEFLPEYRKGRKAYLQVVVQQKRAESTRIDGQIRESDFQIRQVRLDQARLDGRISELKRRGLYEIGDAGRSDLEGEKSDLSFRESQIQYEIQKMRKSQQTLEREAQDAEREALTL